MAISLNVALCVDWNAMPFWFSFGWKFNFRSKRVWFIGDKSLHLVLSLRGPPGEAGPGRARMTHHSAWRPPTASQMPTDLSKWGFSALTGVRPHFPSYPGVQLADWDPSFTSSEGGQITSRTVNHLFAAVGRTNSLATVEGLTFGEALNSCWLWYRGASENW